MAHEKTPRAAQSRAKTTRRKTVRGRKAAFKPARSHKSTPLRGEIRDVTTGEVLKSFTISKPLLPKKSKNAQGSAVQKQGVSGRHTTRAATVAEIRAHLGISKQDVERAQQLLLDLKL
jgi:hypothetical protein